MKKAVLYINQFFGQIGGEDQADFAPVIKTEPFGVAAALNAAMKGVVEVTHTIICGDNYMGSRQEEALAYIMGELKKIDFDVFIAGPAFQAGRYGSACGVICKNVKDVLGKEVVTSMHEENPGVDMFRQELVIFRGGKSAAAMRGDVAKMADYLTRLVKGEAIGLAEEEGYFPHGVRHQVWLEPDQTADKRVIDMLLKKVHGQPFVTELPIPKSDRVPIAPPVKDLSETTIAVVTTGGVVPVDNPDRIQSASATRWGRYDVEGMERLEAGVFKTIHAGYDPAVCDANPNVCVPVDALRHLEKSGKIRKLHHYFYSTVGTGTTQAEATRMGNEIASQLKDEQVDAVLMVST